MSYIKLCKKEIQNNLMLYLFIMLQSIVVFIAIILGVSIFMQRYEKYLSIKKLIGDDGVIVASQHLFLAGENPDNTLCGENSEISELFSNADVKSSYQAWCSYESGEGLDYGNIEGIIYDSDIVEAYKPQIERGRWLQNKDCNSKVVEAVITPNDLNLDVGSVFYITKSADGNPLPQKITVEIVGVLADNADIIHNGVNPFKGPDKDLRDCYFRYSSEYYNKLYIMYIKEDLNNTEYEMFGRRYVSTPAVERMQFISFDGLSEEAVSNINDCLKSPKCITSNMIEMDEFTVNSKAYIWSQLNEVIPVFIGLLVLVFTSVVCVSSLTTKNQLRNYAVYYILGLKWNDCVKIQCLQQILLQITAFIITIAGYLFVYFNDKLKDTVINVGIPQLTGCFLYLVFVALISVIMPYSILKKKTPKTIMT